MTDPHRWVDAHGNPPPPDITAVFEAVDRPAHPPLPTADECSAKAQVGEHLWAFWWPSMGGYVVRAVVRSVPDDCCQEIWIWHDGEFPYDDRPPVRITSCDPGGWVRMGEFLGGLP
jgi:hypothetical protein